MDLNSFINELEANGYDTSSGEIQEAATDCFEYQNTGINITYQGDRWYVRCCSMKVLHGFGSILAVALADIDDA